ACADLLEHRRPLGIAERVVVEEEEVLGVRGAAVDPFDRRDRADLALFLGHHAEVARESAPTLREPDASRELRVHAVIDGAVIDADSGELRGEIPAGTAQDDAGVDGAGAFGERPGAEEDQRAVDPIPRTVVESRLDARVAELQGALERPLIVGAAKLDLVTTS